MFPNSQTFRGSEADPLLLLTYLLSFFSGGDFLSQPWQMISAPLMFACWLLCLLLVAGKRSAARQQEDMPAARGSARLFTALSALASPRCRLRPPWGNQSGEKSGGDRRCAARLQSTLDRTLSQKVPCRTPEDGEPQGRSVVRGGETTQLMRAEEVSLRPGLSAVCFPCAHHAHHRAPRAHTEGWAAKIKHAETLK